MLKRLRRALQKSNNVERDTYIWNTATGIISAAQSVVILMVMTRTNGVDDAGVFSIAYAVGCLMIFIGQYGLRRFQSSDVKEQFLFADYLGVRIITCTAMLIASLGFCFYGVFFNQYSWEKFIVVFLICFLKLIQAAADVIHGRMQQKGRLDVAGKASSSRMTLEILSYIAALAITHDLILSTIICITVTFIVFLLTTINLSVDYCTLKPRFIPKELKGLFIAGFPLFCSYFLAMYISNAPRYAIDAHLSDQIQAYFNFIFMPTFMVGVVANFIFNPILTTYAKIWVAKQAKRLKWLIARQILIIAGLTVLGLICAFFIGIPVLSLIFGVDLTAYRMELCVVMAGGGMLAYVTFFTTVITIIRHQNTLLIGYVGIALCAKIFSGYFVVNYGIMGAAVLYSILMGILAITFFTILVIKFKQDTEKWKDQII